MDWSNADFAPHMEERQADFALHIERRPSFRDQIIAKTAIFAQFWQGIIKTTNMLEAFITYVTTFENKKYFEKVYL